MDGEPVELSTPKLRVLLAALLVRSNRPVAVDRLVEHLWGQHPPANARKTVQIYILRLRRLLADDPHRPTLILTRPDGYLIALTEDQLDLTRFTAAVTAADRAPDLAEQAACLDRAEACWRGRALTDLPDELLHREIVPQLDEERMRAVERRMRAHLDLGRHREIIGDLVRLTEEHPWRESLWALLILALHLSGRQAEALATYRAVDSRFRAELGVDPGEELRLAHRTVLAAERPVVVGQLPAGIRGFTGRAGQIDKVAGLLSAEPDGSPPIVLVCGAPGIGKTAFAVRVAHQLRACFPDGQLYVDLRGFAASAPLVPEEVLARFLGALGVPRERVPVDPDDRSALFRSLIADRRMLVVLDNAGLPSQVRPLLPGVPGCAVLITSRDDLRGLGVGLALDRVRLGELDHDEAREVLAAQIGPERAGAEPAAIARLVELCARLPLALRIAGANLAADPHRGLADYAAELAQPGRLARLVVDGDETSAVRTAYGQSIMSIRPDDRTALRALAVESEFCSTRAAELLDTTPLAVRRVLDRLTAVNMLCQYAPDRFRIPELIREFVTTCPGGSAGASLASVG